MSARTRANLGAREIDGSESVGRTAFLEQPERFNRELADASVQLHPRASPQV